MTIGEVMNEIEIALGLTGLYRREGLDDHSDAIVAQVFAFGSTSFEITVRALDEIELSAMRSWQR